MKHHSIERPVEFENALDHRGEPLTIGLPDALVMRAEEYLRPSSFVADIGAGQCQNSLLLAEFGHEVHAIDRHPGYLKDGRKAHGKLGELVARCYFEAADVSEIDLGEEIYDAVVATRSLHEIVGRPPLGLLDMLQQATKPGGLNVIRAYVATPSEQIVMTEFDFFEPETLQGAYSEAGWEVIYHKSEHQPVVFSKDGPICMSTDEIIARKPQA
jgi:ubiquinone/menaquinone biosynthesis C-methylase UbiE